MGRAYFHTNMYKVTFLVTENACNEWMQIENGISMLWHREGIDRDTHIEIAQFIGTCSMPP